MPNITYTQPALFKYSSLLSLVISLGLVFPVFAYEVSVHADETTAGSADKVSDVAYEIKDNDCLIRWNAAQFKRDEKRVLTVYRQCEKSFVEQADYHEAILERINLDVPITSFNSLSWGGFSYKDDHSWVLPIAVASDRSKSYLDYRQNYPYAKVNNINQIFVELANETHAYQPLADLFDEFGLTLILHSVEKVFTSKAGKLSFYDDLRDHKVGQHARVIYDVGSSYFLMAPVQAQ